MKRIALLTVLLLVVGLTATFAIDVKPTLALSGSGSLTWGFDLDTSDTGFKNASTASFTLSLLAADGSDTHAGTGAAYGSITLSNIEFYWTDTNAATFGPIAGDVSAKIIVTPFEIGVYPVPAMGADLLGSAETTADRVVDSTETAFVMPGSGFGTPYGTYLAATFGPATVKVEVVSDGDWTNPVADEYAFGADVTVVLKPFTLAGGYWMGSTANSFSVKATLDNAPIVVWAGFEGVIPIPAAAMTFGAGAGATFTIVADTTLAASVWYGDTFHGLDMTVVFTEPGDKGLVPMLDTSVTFKLLDVGGTLTSEWEVITATGYKIGLNSDASNYVRPYVNFTYGSNTNNGAADLATAETVMYAEVGAQLQIIPLTLFTAKWVSGAASGADLASSPATLGSVQFVATVTY